MSAAAAAYSRLLENFMSPDFDVAEFVREMVANAESKGSSSPSGGDTTPTVVLEALIPRSDWFRCYSSKKEPVSRWWSCWGGYGSRWCSYSKCWSISGSDSPAGPSYIHGR